MPRDVQPGEPRRFRVAANRVDLAAVAGVAEHDVGEHGEGEEDDHRHRHRPKIRPWPHQTKSGSKPRDRPARGEEKRGAAERRHAAERDHEGRHPEAA